MSAFKGWNLNPFGCLFGHKWYWTGKSGPFHFWGNDIRYTITVECGRCEKSITTQLGPEPKK